MPAGSRPRRSIVDAGAGEDGPLRRGIAVDVSPVGADEALVRRERTPARQAARTAVTGCRCGPGHLGRVPVGVQPFHDVQRGTQESQAVGDRGGEPPGSPAGKHQLRSDDGLLGRCVQCTCSPARQSAGSSGSSLVSALIAGPRCPFTATSPGEGRFTGPASRGRHLTCPARHPRRQGQQPVQGGEQRGVTGQRQRSPELSVQGVAGVSPGKKGAPCRGCPETSQALICCLACGVVHPLAHWVRPGSARGQAWGPYRVDARGLRLSPGSFLALVHDDLGLVWWAAVAS